MEFSKVYTVSTQLTHKDFLRALMVKLASHPDTPTDVCNATFGEVKESVKEVIACKAHVECDYSASVGYDRKEEYWDKEKRKENGIEYYVDVKKTRTVTDWHPHSGHIAGDAAGFVFNEEPKRDGWKESVRIRDVMASVDKESLEEGGAAEVSRGGLETAKMACVTRTIQNIVYPGDRHANESVHPIVEVSSITCFKVPYYEVEFTYNGKVYHASGFACGKPNAETELPPNNVNIQEQVVKETKPLKIGAIAASVATGILFVLGMFVSAWMWLIDILALGSAVTLFVMHKKKSERRLHELRTENKTQKRNALKRALLEKRYAELTDEEEKLFN